MENAEIFTTAPDAAKRCALAHSFNRSLAITFVDVDSPGISRTISVAAPWCQLVPSLANLVYNDNGTVLSPVDDTVNYNVTVSSLYTGTNFSVNGTSLPYGSSHPLTGLVPGALQTYNFVDSADASCTASFPVIAPAIIGTSRTSGSDRYLLSAPNLDAAAVAWVINPSTKTISINNGGQGVKVFRSEVLDLSSISGAVNFSGTVTALDISSGFEPNEDFLKVELLLNDGASITTVHLTAAYDTDSSGLMQGTELAGPGQTNPFALSYTIPDAVLSAQLVVTGVASSTSETLRVTNLLFEPTARLQATPGTVALNNQGTSDPADDSFSCPVTISPVDLGASTGWTAAPGPPGSGNYTDPNPVIFGPFLKSDGPTTVVLTNVPNSAYQSSFQLTPPPVTFTATGVTDVVANDNLPGAADDTLTFTVTSIAGANGGPGWVCTTANASPATGPFGSATITIPHPAAGVSSVPVVFTDVSYSAATATVNVVIPPKYVFGTITLPGLVQDIKSIPGATTSPRWTNDPVAKTLTQLNPAIFVGDLGIVSSAAIPVGTVAGAKKLVLSLDVSILTGAGSSFENSDTLKVEVIEVSPTGTTTTALTAPWDTNGDGVVSGSGLDATDYLATADEFNRNATIRGTPFDHALEVEHAISATVTSVQVVITGVNNSSTERYVIREVSIVPATTGGTQDTDNDGVSDADEALAGTDPNNPASVLRIATFQANPGPANTAALGFPTVNGRVYRVYGSTDLLTWESVSGTIPGTGNVHTVDVAAPLANEPKRYYRVRVGPVGVVFP